MRISDFPCLAMPSTAWPLTHLQVTREPLWLLTLQDLGFYQVFVAHLTKAAKRVISLVGPRFRQTSSELCEEARGTSAVPHVALSAAENEGSTSRRKIWSRVDASDTNRD